MIDERFADPDSAFFWDAWAPTFPYDPDAEQGLIPIDPDRARGLTTTEA